jgi:hypothetical protein
MQHVKQKIFVEQEMTSGKRNAPGVSRGGKRVYMRRLLATAITNGVSV